ncbi:leucine-rich repeat serine/threonine-protein kinase 1-like [Helicoverpa armigera]|uniref:leucine-rich repeat serine/threonine-protein kinase 1-like n=1 Tax=Helicoverpa armigera TaxID=29058 RepID=UPI0030832FAD
MGGNDGTRDRRRSRSASAAVTARGSAGPSPARPAYNNDRDSPWTALSIAARAKNVQIVELLLQHGATDPHCRAIRECSRHSLTELLAKLLATKAYPDPDYKLNKSMISEALFSSRSGDSALTYSSLCPTVAVMLNWRELRAQLATIRMSWLRQAALRVNSKLSSSSGALHALTRIDLSNNELRLLPPELFTMLSLRYLNAAQNKLERLPTLEDPFEEDLDSKRRKKKSKTRPELYSAPVLQELYLQDNRLEELPALLFRLPSLSTLDVSNNKLRALPAAMWSAPALRDLNVALNHLRDLPQGCEGQSECGSPQQLASPSETSPQLSASPSIGSAQFAMATQSKSSSRSPSIERSESEAADDDDDEAVPVLSNRAGNAVWSEARRAHTWRGVVEGGAPPRGGAPLACLNLAHNQFTCVPAALACRATNLTRLNMAYNSLRSMSYVTAYPTSLRQLDLSHNEITCWPSLPQVSAFRYLWRSKGEAYVQQWTSAG